MSIVWLSISDLFIRYLPLQSTKARDSDSKSKAINVEACNQDTIQPLIGLYFDHDNMSMAGQAVKNMFNHLPIKTHFGAFTTIRLRP
ncbi:hypothetical protein DSO57_1010625 [Entomophthora muscae]|uniref:Uncharacterized protein n=1 Tax=Entomophthora muscae TaxID=34485 RepID=A0ACC2S8I3_9FUNG|nr:hypothetical protein DSO57_1010625 [Entomophthora muscae]